MNFDNLTIEERKNVLAEIADLYYNKGMTQQDIARKYETNRFRIAKLIQDARDEEIVEIRIHRSENRHEDLESELMKHYPLSKAIVINSDNSSYAEVLSQIGSSGASYISSLLSPDCYLALAWGKTILPITEALQPMERFPIHVVQIAGSFNNARAGMSSGEMVRSMARKFGGSEHCLRAPLYIKDASILPALKSEPMIAETLETTRHLDILLSGIGSLTSVPLSNPFFSDYVGEEDKACSDDCIGTYCGYLIGKDGKIMDIGLNKRVMSADLSDILTTPHRIVASLGRHKVDILHSAMNARLFNELITDSDTARELLGKQQTV